MSTKRDFQNILIITLLFIFMFVSTNSFVKAQTGKTESGNLLNEQTVEGTISVVTPVPGGPGYIMVSAYDFQPATESDLRGFNAANLYNPSTTSPAKYATGLSLPHGATIKQLTLYYKDNAPAEAIFLYFGQAYVGGWYADMASIMSPSNEPNYLSTSVTSFYSPIIDNQSYSYFLTLDIPASNATNLLVSGVRIDYEYTNSVPLVMRGSGR